MTNTIHMLPSATEGQMMSIILTTAEGGLILIDGGRREDAAPLLDYLKKTDLEGYRALIEKLGIRK